MNIEEIKNTVIQGDCLEVLKQLPDKCVDLVLTDPPYGLNMAARRNIGTSNLAQCKDYGTSDWDKAIPSAELFAELKRVSHHQIVWGGNYFTDVLGKATHWLYWDKDNFDADFSDGELAWTSYVKNSIRRFKYRWAGMLQEPGFCKEERFHPTQKPVALMEWCLRKYSIEGQIILDPFLGSGTTAVACYRTRRNYIGIEINENYCQIARKRLQDEKDKLALFPEERTA